jgi:hypothetical protein
LSDQRLAIVVEGDDRWRRASALGILDDLRRFALHDRHAGICRAEVDADDFIGHDVLLLAGRL